jgi:glycerol kinase
VPVERPTNVESTVLGAAFLAGLQCGVFASTDEIASLWSRNAVFEPEMDDEQRTNLYAGWRRAVARVKS